MTDESSIFVDGESQTGYSTNDLTFRSILLTHLSRITRIASQEFHGGYWKKVNRVVGSSIMTDDVYVPNTREQYTNAVNNLSDLLLPYFDEEMIKAEKEHIALVDKMIEDLDKEQEEKKFNDQAYSHKRSVSKQKLKRELFRSLNLFMKRKNYLELGELEE